MKTGEKSPINISREFSLLDGALRLRYSDSEESRGETVGYYKNGQLRFKYPLCKGALHGTGVAWYENGQPICEEEFCFGFPHGRRRTWYMSGAIESEVQLVVGRRQGEYKEWHENGKIRMRREYLYHERSGREMIHGTETKWYKDGKIAAQISYTFGVRHGACRIWDQSSKLSYRGLFVRGVRVSGELHRHIEAGTLSAKHILKITNAAVRRVCLEELGYGRFMSQVKHLVIDRDGEYELVKIDWYKHEDPIYLVKVKCPSTGAFYTLRVPPTMKTVKDAVAWTFGMNKDEYNPEIEA